ncbi:hypothetical protein AB0L40_16955 [Patulibacter sp. NPDC049589]|uniref:ATP-grasp domain-containing protein n=1 Tax=Patulibacter sp. NPDC049589 TaxID=3154731 RepID=UPI003434B0A5
MLRTTDGNDGDLEVALITGGASGMPVPDQESHLLVAALADRGVRSAVVAWDDERDWSRVPLVVCRSPWDYVARADPFLHWVRATGAVTRLLNPAGLLEWNLHKRYLTDLIERGVPVVPTTALGPGSSAAARTAALAVEGDVVIKPAISGGAKGTIRVAAQTDEAREHLAALLRSGDALVQPYLPEVEDGEVSLVLFAGELSHAVRKVPASGDFRVQEEHGGVVLPHDPTDAEQAVARRVLEALPWPSTYARIDLVTTPDGPLLMEAELVEPELFLRAVPAAAGTFADVLVADLRG